MRSLAEIMNDPDRRQSLDRILDMVEVLCSVIGEVVEDVRRVHSRFSFLFGPKDEIDPLVEMSTDVWALECLPMLGDEDVRISIRPWWECHPVD